MEKLIDDSLADALLNQLVHEKFNSNLYLYIGGWLKNKGLDGLASHFMGQYEEELDHSLIIFNLLTDLSTDVEIREIDAVNLPINNIMDIAIAYLEREILTTKSLADIKNLAIENDNPVVEERIRKMIKLQQNEYEEATSFMDKAILTGGDWKFVFMWDLQSK